MSETCGALLISVTGLNVPANCNKNLLSWLCTKWMQGSSLCNRRFVCLNAGNTPLKKYNYTSVIGSLNAFSNLLNLFALPHSDSKLLELVADFGVFSLRK